MVCECEYTTVSMRTRQEIKGNTLEHNGLPAKELPRVEENTSELGYKDQGMRTGYANFVWKQSNSNSLQCRGNTDYGVLSKACFLAPPLAYRQNECVKKKRVARKEELLSVSQPCSYIYIYTYAYCLYVYIYIYIYINMYENIYMTTVSYILSKYGYSILLFDSWWMLVIFRIRFLFYTTMFKASKALVAAGMHRVLKLPRKRGNRSRWFRLQKHAMHRIYLKWYQKCMEVTKNITLGSVGNLLVISLLRCVKSF